MRICMYSASVDEDVVHRNCYYAEMFLRAPAPVSERKSCVI